MLKGLTDKLGSLMIYLGRGGYESEHTKYIREWMEKNPQQVKEQAAGRALWWDKQPVSLDDMKTAAAAKVPSKPYYYQPE